jgi:cytochrome c biogenesis protein CcmG/thiol:disulfide interchange protein DsbE
MVSGCLLFGVSWLTISAVLYKPAADVQSVAPAKGFYAPDFNLDQLDGSSFTLSDHLGQPILLTLWTSWCSPCKAEMPTFNQVYQEMGAENVLVIGVNVTSQDDPAKVKDFVELNNLTFPVVLDTQGEAANLYRLRGFPMNYFINSQGKITDVIIGGPLSAGTVRSIFNDLLQEK